MGAMMDFGALSNGNFGLFDAQCSRTEKLHRINCTERGDGFVEIEAAYVLEKSRGYAVLALKPQLNSVQWGDIQQLGNELIPDLELNNASVLVVDLSQLDYMGSSMVALLVRVWKSIKTRDGEMVVQSKTKMVTEVLTIAGLDSLWDIVETREEALKAIGAAGSAGRGSWIAPAVGLLAVVAAGGLYTSHQLDMATLLVDPQLTSAVLGLSTLALLAGILAVVRCGGVRRAIGAVALLASLAVGAATLLGPQAAADAGTQEPPPETGANRPTSNT